MREPVGTAYCQLVQEMLPLERHLTRTDRDGWRGSARWAELGLVEPVVARYCLGVHARQVEIDGQARVCMSPEPFQLRMVEITTCFASQDSPCKQRLAPQGDETLRIEILRVQ